MKLRRRIKAPRPPRLVLSATNVGSRGLKALANSLSEKVGYRVLRVLPHRILNRPHVLFHQGLDKITQLRHFSREGVSSPEFVCDSASVNSLASKRIVARQLINASEGRGIVVFSKEETPVSEIPRAPLYVGYITKKKEFRVHVFDNEVIDVAEKRKRKSHDAERDAFVRNTANGYVFCRNAVMEPRDLRNLALSAVRAIGRSQGAVDVIWNEKQDKCYVLEVNSRPGMEGTTVEKYANAIVRKHMGPNAAQLMQRG